MAELGIGLMARAPEVGRVKTRLAASIGDQKATMVYRDLLMRISGELIGDTEKLCGADVGYSWFADPASAIAGLSAEFEGFEKFFEQSSGDLGERMSNALGRLLQGNKFAALIGADIPDVTGAHIRETLEVLGDELKGVDVVLGPTFDGGYYLIGMNRVYAELFEGIPWSANDTFEKTIAACEASNLKYHLLEELSDLDVLEDFKRIKWRPDSVEI